MLILAVMAFGLISVGDAWALGTPAGTTIQNQARGVYEDANGNAIADTAFSNIVQTTVLAVAAIDVSPDTSAQFTTNDTPFYHPSTITNLGNDTDTLTVTAVQENQVGSGTWTHDVYHDVNENGTFDAGTDTVLTLTDIILAADDSINVLIKVTSPITADQDDAVDVRLTAQTSANKSNAQQSDDGAYTTIINAATIEAPDKSHTDDGSPQPGDVITYKIVLTNTGSDTAFNFVAHDTVSSDLINIGGLKIATSATVAYGDASTQTVGASDDSMLVAGQIVKLEPLSLAPGDTIVMFFQAEINAGVAATTVINNSATAFWENRNGDPQGPNTGPDDPLTVEHTPDVLLETIESEVDGVTDNTGAPDSLFADADPSDSVFYTIDLINPSNASDDYRLSSTTTEGFPIEIFVDTNGDGVLDAAELAAGPIDTTVAQTVAADDTLNLIAVVIPPAGTSNGTEDETVVTVVAEGDPSVTDSVYLTTTVTAPVLDLDKWVNTTFTLSPGTSDTIKTAQPGDTLYYTIRVENLGDGEATNVLILDLSGGGLAGGEDFTTYAANSTSVFNGNLGTAGTGLVDDAGGAAPNVAKSGDELTVSLGTMSELGGGTDVKIIRFKVVIRSTGVSSP